MACPIGRVLAQVQLADCLASAGLTRQTESEPEVETFGAARARMPRGGQTGAAATADFSSNGLDREATVTSTLLAICDVEPPETGTDLVGAVLSRPRPCRPGTRGAVLRAPEACWWALHGGESTLTVLQSIRPSASASAWRACRIRSHVPSADQQRCRSYTVFHFPNRGGRSRQGIPVR